MKLAAYLKEENISVAGFARLIRVSRITIYSYVNGEKIPSANTMKKIVRVTNNKVQPNDFYELPASQLPVPYRSVKGNSNRAGVSE